MDKVGPEEVLLGRDLQVQRWLGWSGGGGGGRVGGVHDGECPFSSDEIWLGGTHGDAQMSDLQNSSVEMGDGGRRKGLRFCSCPNPGLSWSWALPPPAEVLMSRSPGLRTKGHSFAANHSALLSITAPSIKLVPSLDNLH